MLSSRRFHSSIFRASLRPHSATLAILLMLLFLMLGLLFLTLTARPEQAQTYTVIHNFSYGLDGGWPWAGVTIDASGSLYGTTTKGSPADRGTGDGLLS